MTHQGSPLALVGLAALFVKIGFLALEYDCVSGPIQSRLD